MQVKQVISNYVLIKPNIVKNQYKLPNGKTMIFAKTKITEHFGVTAEVIKVPEKLTMPKDRFDKWKVDMELEEGDTVWVDYLPLMAKLGELDAPAEYISDKKIFISYFDIYGTKRDGKIIPINGNIYIEPVEYKIETNLKIPDNIKKKKKFIGKVFAKGKPCKYYYDGKDYSYDSKNIENEIQVGDYLLLRDNGIPVERKFYRTLDGDRELRTIQYRDIFAKVNKDVMASKMTKQVK